MLRAKARTPLLEVCWVIAGTILTTALSGFLNDASGENVEKAGMEALTQNLRPRYAVGNTMPRYSLEKRMAAHGVPGVAIGVIEDGKLVHAQGFGVLQEGKDDKVDADTLFSAGSVSKVATATLVLRMHTVRQLDIDKSIETYLTSWQLPDTDVADGTDISLRMILSHTAGFNLHGFGDFLPGEALPGVYETLNGKSPAKHDPLTLLFKPGTRYKYSGGGYTLAQLIVTDVSEQSFSQTAKTLLLDPLGMKRSSFVNPLPKSTANVAKAHNSNGQPAALPRGYEAMPEMAASGLWTSANELGRLVAALIRSYRAEGGFLPQHVATDMMTKVSPSEHGLSPRLEGTANGRFFHHAGSNNSYRAWIEGHLATGDGLVVLTNGAGGNDLFVEIRNAAADTFGWEINKPVHIPPVPVNDEVLAGYAGSYQPDGSFPVAHREQVIGWMFDDTLEVALKDGKLSVSRQGRDNAYELIPTAPNRFLVSGFDERVGVAELVFHRDVHAQTNSLTFAFPGARSFYNRVSGAAD